MDFSTMLSQAMFWPGYQAANPKTTKDDVAMIRAAIAQMPAPPALVRMDERPQQKRTPVGTNGWSNPDDPTQVHLVRNGPAYLSQDPVQIAGTLTHEQAHLTGADEIAAREAQLAFLRDKMATGGYKNKKLVKMLEQNLRDVKDPTTAMGIYYADQRKPKK